MSAHNSACRCALLLAALLIGAPALRAQAVAEQVILSGSTTPGGGVTLEVSGTPGASALLALGGAFAIPPLTLLGKPFYIDVSQPWWLLDLGVLPTDGQLLLPAVIPAAPALLGLQIHVQAAAPGLSNVTSLAIHAPEVVVSPAAAGSGFGLTLFVHDLDGDLRDDLVTGALQGAAGQGAAWISFGPDPQPAVPLLDPTPQAGGLFGSAFAVGDFLGGPDLDLAVGALGAGPLLADSSGEVWIFEGPDFATATLLTSPLPAPAAGFGSALAAGDFDGDGATELVVGEQGATVGGDALAGRVYVFGGPGLVLQTILVKPPAGAAAGALFGGALAAGDIGGDGKDDLVVSAAAAELSGLPQVGEVWIFAGPLTGAPVLLQDVHPDSGSAFGVSLALGDLLGDARLDVVVGVPGGQGSPPGGPVPARVGEVQVFDAGDPSAATVFDDPTPEDLGHFGFDVAVADTDGNGAADLLVGANLADLAGLVDAGEAFLYLGPDLVVRLEVSTPAPEAGGLGGSALGGADLDGDGRDALILGAPGEAGGAGRVFVIDF